MAQIFFTKSKQRPSVFATFGLVVVFLSLVTLLGAGPVTGWYQQTNQDPEALLRWRLKLMELTGLLLVGGSFATFVGILHGRFSSRVRTSWRGFVAVMIGVLVAIPVWLFSNAANNSPPIHDVSTDLVDPPYFRHLEERSYSTSLLFEILGGRLDPSYAAVHGEAYPDISPIRINITPTVGLKISVRVAEKLGWTIENTSAQYGQVEASYLHPFYNLRSKIAIRVRVDGKKTNGEASIIDIRAVLGTGVTDYGLNAELIREFLVEFARETP